MITQLYIENVAVIEKAFIDFGKGFTVITGETGAGKSILIDSINAILGQRAKRDMVRSKADKAVVIASFDDIPNSIKDKLQNLDFDYENLIIQRNITCDGKSTCRINDRPVSLSVLKEIAHELININGQNESFELLNTDKHIHYLDGLGDYNELLISYRNVYSELLKKRAKLQAILVDDSQKLREIDLLKYQIQELENANFTANEPEELEQRRNILTNSEKISFSLNEVHDLLNGNEESNGVLPSLQTALTQLDKASVYMDSLNEISTRLDNIFYELKDCCDELRDIKESIEYSPEELNEIEQRLDLFSKLSRKYGSTVEEQSKFLSNSKSRLDEIELSEQNRQKITEELAELEKDAQKLAFEISRKRKETALIFAEKVKAELKFLDMPKVCFRIKQELSDLNKNGCDNITFEISVNPGESPKPLSKVASGGELSRIMLAIKTVITNDNENATLIFDEIDAGISGSTSEKVGLKLKELSKKRQLMCVTHSAQIASLADEHFLISKEINDDKTYTHISSLDFEGRKKEIARIISGVHITEINLKNAEEMLRNR